MRADLYFAIYHYMVCDKIGNQDGWAHSRGQWQEPENQQPSRFTEIKAKKKKAAGFQLLQLWNVKCSTYITVHQILASLDTLYIYSILTIIQYLFVRTKENRMVYSLHETEKCAHSDPWLIRTQNLQFSNMLDFSMGPKMMTLESCSINSVFCWIRKKKQFIQ